MRSTPPGRFHSVLRLAAAVAILGWATVADGALAVPFAGESAGLTNIGHLVVSEVMTGGASASDEFVELYNPSADTLALDGLELVYVTASGATITRKATWGPGAVIAPRAHLLVANEAGIFAGIADQTYANGLAATGGSMALRPVGGSTAIDAVGWGSAASTWMEPAPAPAPPVGSSLERLPGGELGSGQDTDQNLVDFVVRPLPDPQNSASLPGPSDPASPTPSLEPTPVSTPTTPSPSAEPSSTVDPSSTAIPSATPLDTPSPSPTPLPTPEPTPAATPTPTATSVPTPAGPISIASARALPDDAEVLVRGVTLSASDFTEGGGYLADDTGGIAILLSDGSFPQGVELLVHGVVDDRFAQRTIRASDADLVVGPPATEPDPLPVETGVVGEAVEGRLVAIGGEIQGSATTLSAGLAYELDDGSGPIRVLVSTATGIDTTTWEDGTSLEVVGVVGQRDSSGTGSEGYRVQPRTPGDVTMVEPSATPVPTPSPSTPPSPSATASPAPSGSSPPLVTIAQARLAEAGAQIRIRGVVTLPTGLIEEGSGVVADTSGAILVRTSGTNPRLRRGQLVELTGTRSTKAGMLSLRVSQSVPLGSQAEPDIARRTTGRIGEDDEALLVVVRGLVQDSRRTSGGGLSFTVDDGSGALRVFVAAATGITTRQVPGEAWVEIRGVVGQQTTGTEPNAGYRLWPRDRGDVRLIATTVSRGGGAESGASGTSGGSETQTATPVPSLKVIRPSLEGSLSGATHEVATALTMDRPSRRVPPIPVPLAAGLGGLAGLAVLAWRHGTWARLQDEMERRMAVIRSAAHGGAEEDDAYTPAP